MTTKLRIDVTSGLLEVEGEESFVSRIYDDFKEQLQAQPKVPKARRSGRPRRTGLSGKDASNGESSAGTQDQKPKRAKVKESFTIVKDLDLSGKGKSSSLRDFFKEKAPASAMENNVVFVYYLSQTMKVPKITLDHIYTCYKNVGQRVPAALRQSVLDSSFRKGWLDTKSMDDIKLPTIGENFVEHDLPPKKEAKSK